jgi:hypothetical protein
MLNKILTYGTIAGLIVGAVAFGTAFAWDGESSAGGMAFGYATMLLALSAVFVAIKRHRDEEGGGVIRFWPAFGLGLGISALAGLFYVIGWEAAMAVTDRDFIGVYTAQMIEQKRAAGVSAAELARYTAEMRDFAVQYQNPLYRMPITFSEIFPVGVLVSLVSAALLRNPRFLARRRESAPA